MWVGMMLCLGVALVFGVVGFGYFCKMDLVDREMAA